MPRYQLPEHRALVLGSPMSDSRGRGSTAPISELLLQEASQVGTGDSSTLPSPNSTFPVLLHFPEAHEPPPETQSCLPLQRAVCPPEQMQDSQSSKQPCVSDTPRCSPSGSRPQALGLSPTDNVSWEQQLRLQIRRLLPLGVVGEQRIPPAPSSC